MITPTSLEIVKHHKSYEPSLVIAAIDDLCRYRFVLPEHIHDALIDIKWSYHYPCKIDNVKESLYSNPGFYADAVIWLGWHHVQCIKQGKEWREMYKNRGKIS